MVGRPGSGKSELISEVELQFQNFDAVLFNIKPEITRLGSVDFLVPLLKKISDKNISLTNISVAKCIKKLSEILPKKSFIVFEDIHLGNVYTERNICLLLNSRPDLLILPTSRYEIKHYRGSSETVWILNFEKQMRYCDFCWLNEEALPPRYKINI